MAARWLTVGDVQELLQLGRSAAYEVMRAAGAKLVGAGNGALRLSPAAPIPLENSRQLALVAVDKSRIDGKLGLPILRAAVGDRADAACSVSKAGLAQIAGKGAAKVLLEQLGRAGAVEEWTEQHLREVKAPVAVLEPHDHELAHTAPPSRGDGG